MGGNPQGDKAQIKIPMRNGAASLYVKNNQGVRISHMNAQTDISMKTNDVLRVELEVFRREHRDLDEAIEALGEKTSSDQLTLRRLKKQKLLLKDKIALIEDRLTPDIIA